MITWITMHLFELMFDTIERGEVLNLIRYLSFVELLLEMVAIVVFVGWLIYKAVSHEK